MLVPATYRCSRRSQPQPFYFDQVLLHIKDINGSGDSTAHIPEPSDLALDAGYVICHPAPLHLTGTRLDQREQGAHRVKGSSIDKDRCYITTRAAYTRQLAAQVLDLSHPYAITIATHSDSGPTPQYGQLFDKGTSAPSAPFAFKPRRLAPVAFSLDVRTTFATATKYCTSRELLFFAPWGFQSA